MLTEEEINNAQATLNELRVEHRDLNLIVEHLAATPIPEQDQLLIHRLKKNQQKQSRRNRRSNHQEKGFGAV